jgi:hypothetical protein
MSYNSEAVKFLRSDDPGGKDIMVLQNSDDFSIKTDSPGTSSMSGIAYDAAISSSTSTLGRPATEDNAARKP